MPAAGRGALTRAYDPALALTMRERRFRGLLRAQVSLSLPQGGTVIDVGSGTGSFAIDLAGARPDAHVSGVDGDAEVLSTAQRKRGAKRVSWQRGLASELPVADDSADAVVMSLLLHHLDPAGKAAALKEALRILRPGGRLHVADWGRPHDPLMRGAFFVLQVLDGFPNTRDHAAGRLPQFIAGAGFGPVATHGRLRTMWGSLDLLEARHPPGSGAR